MKLVENEFNFEVSGKRRLAVVHSISLHSYTTYGNQRVTSSEEREETTRGDGQGTPAEKRLVFQDNHLE